jgi:putative DNA primase/helicase
MSTNQAQQLSKSTISTPFDFSEPLRSGEKLAAFLKAFFADRDEQINFRFFAPKGVPLNPNGRPIAPEFSAEKVSFTRDRLNSDETAFEKLSLLNQTRGSYFVVNSGGNSDIEIARYNAWFVEADNLSIQEQHALLDACPLPPSIRVETKKSVHAYWLIERGCTEIEWRDMQVRLIAYFNGDPKNKNPSRVMRVPYFNHITYNGENDLSYKTVEVVGFEPDRRYTIAEMRAAFPEVAPPPRPKWEKRSEGELTAWEALNDELKERITAVARRNGRGNYEMACPAHDGKGATSLVYLPSLGAVACLKRCTHADILTAFGLPAFPVFAKGTELKKSEMPSPSDGDGDFKTQTVREEPEEIRCTDMGNGYRFARQHGEQARYCETAGKWFAWDDKRWIEDNSGEAVRLAKATVKSIYTEAAITGDKDKRETTAKHALRSESDSRITAMLHQAQSELPVKLETFDTDPYLFNCENGTIDLHTGHLRAHYREDMLTKLANITYDEKAAAPKWENFLNQIFQGDEQLIRFIQKAVGYSLTGSTEEQVFFICYGTGANGKSVFLKTIAALLAEYGQQVRTETLMVKKYAGVSNDIACLRGSRFLSAVETESDGRLAEATVKQLTGGDTVRARFLFQEEFEFTPQFKIWLAANHKPQVKGTDNAIWRRIRLIPFNVTIPKEKQNPRLDIELREELSGLLAWAVRGCLLWQHEGLGETEAVTKATEAYRDEMDSLSEFLNDCCVMGENHQATVSELYNRYETWCQSNGEQAQPAKWLRAQLIDRGGTQGRDKKRRFWRGIGLVRDEERG